MWWLRTKITSSPRTYCTYWRLACYSAKIFLIPLACGYVSLCPTVCQTIVCLSNSQSHLSYAFLAFCPFPLCLFSVPLSVYLLSESELALPELVCSLCGEWFDFSGILVLFLPVLFILLWWYIIYKETHWDGESSPNAAFSISLNCISACMAMHSQHKAGTNAFMV